MNNIDNWKSLDDTKSLLFFSQRLNEILFDYTLDTFKAPAVNTSLLCEELLLTIQNNENESIDNGPNVSAILQELKWAYSHDPVAKKILKTRDHQYLEALNIENIKDFKLKIELLYNKLNETKYIETCKSLIIELVQTNGSKKEIDIITKNMVTALLDYGYSQSFLYNSTINFFFRENEISSSDQIQNFLDQITLERDSYECFLLCSPLFDSTKEICEGFNVFIQEEGEFDINSFNRTEKFFFSKKTRKQLILRVEDINAFDPYSAKEVADSRLNKLANLLAFYHHKKKLKWSSRAVVIKKESLPSEAILVTPATPAIIKGTDHKIITATEKLKTLIFRLPLIQQESFSKFNTVIDLHGSALSNKDVENQLLNLWTAIETLVPTGATKIGAVLDNIVPVLEYK